MRGAGLAAGVLGALILGVPAHADTAVDYHGLRIPVPSGWVVHRLGPASTRCLRFDRHVIYLGSAGRNQLCPAHAVGHTEAIHIEPLTAQTQTLVTGMLATDPRTGTAGVPTPAGGMPGLTVRDAGARELRVVMPSAGVLITGTYETGPARLERVLSGVTPAPDQGASERRGATASGRRWVTGPGFDTCTAPSLHAMRAWRAAFVAANIYIGGPARACSDGWLSRGWVAAVRSMGWSLIPTYVGPQAPCSSSRVRFSGDSAAIAGQVSAVDATGRARLLGLPPGTPIYDDLEAYGTHDPACRMAVLTFLDSWSRGIRGLGYTPGVYSSVASGIRDLGEASGISKPSAIWFAHWDNKPDPHDDPYLDDQWWPGHRRIKQYRGSHYEKHGGVKLHIDSDIVDGYVR